MDIDLTQALDEIAADAPTPDLTAGALWRRGIRRRNRRRAGVLTATLAVAALVAGAVGVAATPGTLHTDEAPPASAVDDAHLPDRVWMPSPWTPGTDRAGDPGRIAVLFWDNGRRQSLSPVRRDSGGGFLAVSAVDGSYRYLDLPDLVLDAGSEPALSPDGRYLAYALRSAGADDPAAVTTGWAVYDARSGRTVRHVPRGTPKGVGQSALAWSPDSRTLLADVCTVTQVDAGSLSCETRRTDAWDVATGALRELAGAVASQVVGTAGGDLLLQSGRRLERLDVTTGRTTPVGRVGVTSETGEEAAAVAGGVATVATVRYEGIERGGDALAVDDQTTLALRVTRHRLDGSALGRPWVPVRRAAQVDPLTVGPDGSVTTLTTLPSERPVVLRLTRDDATVVTGFEPGWTGSMAQVARDLLDEPTVPGVRPPEVTDPRAVGGGVGLGLLAAAGLGLAWLRRRRGVNA